MPQLHLTSSQIELAVRELYKKNGYVVLSQVRNGTGYEKRARTSDMLAVSTWPSRGLFIEGIEIKSDKGDLRRELENPAKAEEIAAYCQHWWIACALGLTDGLLIPPNWGVIAVSETLKAKVIKPAATLNPKPLDALLVCSILRNFAEGYVPMAEVNPLVAAAREEGRKGGQFDRSHRLTQLEDCIVRFKTASGIDLMGDRGHPIWNMGAIGDAVKLIVALEGKPVNEIARAKAALVAGVSAIDAALAVMDQKIK